MSPKRRTETPFWEYGGHEEPLIAFIARLQAILDAIPEEFREAAMFIFEGGGDDSGNIQVRHERFETSEEAEANRRWHEQHEAECAAQEKALYENLKQKFEKA